MYVRIDLKVDIAHTTPYTGTADTDLISRLYMPPVVYSLMNVRGLH